MHDLKPHLTRLNLAGSFYGAVLLATAFAGNPELSLSTALAGGGAVALGAAYFHVARKLI